MFHAGVLMKLGAFAALRVGIMLLPDGAKHWSGGHAVATAVKVVYGAFIAFVQTDFKYIVGFSSVSHMGLVMMGFSTLSRDGLVGLGCADVLARRDDGSLLCRRRHGVRPGAHAQIPDLGGFAKNMPWAAVGSSLAASSRWACRVSLASSPNCRSSWACGRRGHRACYAVIAILSAISIIVTAAYVLRVVQQVFFGKLPEKLRGARRPDVACSTSWRSARFAR